MSSSACLKCGFTVREGDAFCCGCGERLQSGGSDEKIGESRDRRRVRVIVPVAEFEVQMQPGDTAEELEQFRLACARLAVIEQVRVRDIFKDRLREGVMVEIVDDLVPIARFPYLCGYCGNVVSDKTAGVCKDCGKRMWVDRTAETEARWRWSVPHSCDDVYKLCSCGCEVWTNMPACPRCGKRTEEVFAG